MRRVVLGSVLALATLFAVWLKFGQTVRTRVQSNGPSCSEIAAFDRMIQADRAREAAERASTAPTSE